MSCCKAHWRVPFRKLVIGMSITVAIIAVFAHVAVFRVLVARGVPARRAALTDRSDPVLGGRHKPAGPGDYQAFAEPRVGAQRRARAAGGARVRGSARRAFAPFRVVAVRAARRRARVRLRARLRAGRLGADATPGKEPGGRAGSRPSEGALRARNRVRDLQRDGAASPWQRLHRGVRRRDGGWCPAGRTCATTSPRASARSRRSSSSECSRCSDRC